MSLSSATPLPTAFAMVTLPGPGRVDDARAADDRVGAELQRVQEIVVHPPVDDVHRPGPRVVCT